MGGAHGSAAETDCGTVGSPGAGVTEADQNLRKIDHIVVLMMENRSFDHMLGFLTIDQGRDDIEGPTLEMKNDYRGESFHVHPASRTTMTKAQDPCHSGWCVDEQVSHDWRLRLQLHEDAQDR